ncbi:hypothetical protein Nepgr_029611 [Nepenthes gracilis]|uniref:Uncharacterized protein n=1 Tax=Nepenthes gracilis TaxID=150966 RepID=A0AAD3TCS5_NEPGR|nr:hypothetical protein Nepgr_029611 [Nepenthes gracilis]
MVQKKIMLMRDSSMALPPCSNSSRRRSSTQLSPIFIALPAQTQQQTALLPIHINGFKEPTLKASLWDRFSR